MKTIQNKNALMKLIETNTGEEIEETLRRLFVDHNYTHQQICDTLQLSYVTVIRWLRLAGIRSRALKLGD